ncbi:L-threonylcarbamoyladenylate synthase [Basilea psittacipulmonis]|uniref:Translation factor Sua5 n=1 Tax=Basilea psittacipulmonis DSM 24701 TaxID=1072685 RepID=A0A077DDS1_9BURK|nr:L-threonylcarbamoyladenylate synthase [Basilea psittacipulmonis]AIL33020.1 translation factor Sua5 [Basilea psittacipulmonis DSM 24701]
MAEVFQVHSNNPHTRVLSQVARYLHDGKVVACPTDSSYALLAHLDDKEAATQLRRLRGLDDRHHLTLLCRDLSEISTFAKVDNRQYRLLKLACPGPWTFILEATKDIPKRVSHRSRKTIGIRVPNNPVILGLIEAVGSPLLSTTLIPEGETEPLNEVDEIQSYYKGSIAAIIDTDIHARLATTVIDLTTDPYEILRWGSGDPSQIGL